MKGTAPLLLPTALISGGIVAALVGFFYFVRLAPSVVLRPVGLTEKAVVRVSAIDFTRPNAIAEDADLLDTVPLFSPTPHNASELEVPAQLRHEPGTQFAPFPARFLYAENNFDLRFPNLEASALTPDEALQVGNTANFLAEMGQVDKPLSKLSSRLALVEIIRAETGEVVYSQAILEPQPSSFPTGDWKPVEMLATMGVSGLIGTPVLTTGGGSGSEEIDAFLTQFLAKRFHLGARTPPGAYVIRIGP